MGNLYVVGTPIGNLSDITKRALDVLKSVDLILCEDTRHSLKLLNYYGIKKKLVSYHKFNEQEKKSYCISLLKKGLNIAIISDAGMPCICDPGYILVNECTKEKIDVYGVGGISAVATAISVSGFDTSSFSFYGFFPRENKDKKRIIDDIKKSNINVFVFYESPKRIINTLQFLKDNLGEFKITVCSDLTKLHEKRYSGDISLVIENLKENQNSDLGEYTFVIEKESTSKEDKKDDISYEALIVDTVFKNNVSIKEAINILSNSYNKNSLKKAALSLKKIK